MGPDRSLEGMSRTSGPVVEITGNALQSVEKELEEAGEQEKEAMKARERQREMINALDLKK